MTIIFKNEVGLGILRYTLDGNFAISKIWVDMKDPLPSRRELEDSGPWPEMMISNLAFPSNHRLINFMTYL